jgi:predicted metal-dependent hydrolase
MRGTFRTFLCCSALALSGGAWAQGTTPSLPAGSAEDKRTSLYAAFDKRATAAEAEATAKEAAAAETQQFLAEITMPDGQPRNQNPELLHAVDGLKAQLTRETAAATEARKLADALRAKALNASKALAALNVAVSPKPNEIPLEPDPPEWRFEREAALALSRQVADTLEELEKKEEKAPRVASAAKATGENEYVAADYRQAADRLEEAHAQYVRSRQDWLSAVAAAARARRAAEAAQDRLKELRDAPEPHLQARIAEETKLLARDQAAFQEAAAKVPAKHASYLAHLAALHPVRDHVRKLADVPDSQPETKEPSCPIDKVEDREAVNPNKCRFAAEGTAGRISQGAFSLPDRPVDRRGITTQLTTSGDKASATIKLAGNSKFRTIPVGTGSVGNFWQSNQSLSYSFGLTADVADSKSRISTIEGGKKYPHALDRLDERLKGTFSLGWNWYDKRSRRAWRGDSDEMYEKARDACIAEQAKTDASPSTCFGPQLTDWIFAGDDKGGYRNAAHVTAFDSLYWGSPESVAREGIGLTVEVAHPRLEYYEFTTREVTNPLKPDEPKTVLDTRTLPAEFLTGDPLIRREWTYAVGLYGFHRIGGTAPTDMALTLIPSFTYTRKFEKPEKVSICPVSTAPVETPPPQFATTQLCEEISPNDGEVTKNIVPALEARMHLPNPFPGRWLIPSVGVAPKISFEHAIDDDNRRYSLDMPIWFGLDSTGKLNGGVSVQHQWGGVKDSGKPKPSETSLSIFVSTTFDLGSK